MADKLPHSTPYAQEWLAFEEQSGGRFLCQGSVHDIRQQFAGLFDQLHAMLPPPGNDVTTAEHETDEGVRVRVYKPAGTASEYPTGLYIHSGGWACGNIDGEDHLCRQLAVSVPCTLVSVEYRLAPEDSFPAGLNDCVSAYRWMADNATILGRSSSKLFTVGGSAGGNYSLTTTLKIMDEYSDLYAKHKPCGIFALCPATCFLQSMKELPDDLRPHEHPDAYGDAAMIDKAACETCEAAYIGSNKPSHPHISPIFHKRLADLPPVYMTTQNKDPLNDDAFMFKHKLQAEGVECTMKEYDGYPHFFHMLPQLEMSQRLMADLAEAIRERCR